MKARIRKLLVVYSWDHDWREVLRYYRGDVRTAASAGRRAKRLQRTLARPRRAKGAPAAWRMYLMRAP